MAIVLKNKNFAKSTLAAGITSGATSLTVATGEGTKFPSTGSFRAVIWGSTYGSPTNDSTREIVTVTNVTGDVLTITRAAESTTAKAWLLSDNIAHVITAGKVDELEADININTAGRAIRDISRNLIVKNNTTPSYVNYQVDIDADEIILQDSSYLPHRATAVNLTADITVNGINGYSRVVKTGTATCATTTVTGTGTLFTTEFAVGDVIWFNTTGVGRRITAIASDTSLTVESSLTISSGEAISNGGEAPSTWYYIWAIYNGTTLASLLSTSSTAPTMPSGYTYKALPEGAAIYNDSSSNFLTTYQQGNRVRCISGNFNHTFSGTGSVESKDLSALIPSTAKTIIFVAYMDNGVAGYIHPVTFTAAVGNTYFSKLFVAAEHIQGNCPIETPQTIFMGVPGGATMTNYVQGWET